MRGEGVKMAGGSQMLDQKLKELEEKRKNGELSSKDFYIGLLSLVAELVNELKAENINEAQIRQQIPLILTFLKSQIKKMADRGN